MARKPGKPIRRKRTTKAKRPGKAGGDFAQRRYYFFVVRFHQWPRALEQLFGAPRRTEHELEAVGNVLQAIFNGNSCH